MVAVGSSERRNERSDPFSGTERKAMLEAYLRESGIRGVRVVTLRDGPSEAWALRNLLRRCHPDVLFLSREKSRLSDLAEGVVRVVRFRRTGSVSSTRIRDAIARNDPSWKRLTGRSVVAWIEQRDGVRRIQRAYGRARSEVRPFRATQGGPDGAGGVRGP